MQTSPRAVKHGFQLVADDDVRVPKAIARARSLVVIGCYDQPKRLDLCKGTFS